MKLARLSPLPRVDKNPASRSLCSNSEGSQDGGFGNPSTTALRALCKQNTARSLTAIVGNISAIVVAIWAAEAIGEPWAACVAVLLIGTRQYGLGEVLVHEASHRHLSGNPKFNDLLGTMLSWPFFFTLEGYRRFHDQHHRIALDDPENSIFEQYEDWRLPLTDKQVHPQRLFWLLVLRPLLGVTAIYHLIGILSDAYYDSDLKENTFMWLAWAAVVVIVWQLGLIGMLLLYWITPLFLVFAALNYWSEIGDHYRTSEALTRSYEGVWWNRLIGGNIGYHVLHHRHPGIPWFRLKAAQQQLCNALLGQRCDGPLMAFAQMRQGYQHVRRDLPTVSQPAKHTSITRSE